MFSLSDIGTWKRFAKENSYKYLLVVHDIAESDYFPMYCNTTQEIFERKSKMISESKLKLIEVILV